MSVSYILRHGRTETSARYLAAGNPSDPVHLDSEGLSQCRRQAGADWTSQIVTCVVSEFPRTVQTANLLMQGRRVRVIVDRRCNEINYGIFEGRPWMEYHAWLQSAGPDAAPPGGESRTCALDRMFQGLAAYLDLPGPRLIVGHGLMISAMLQLDRGGALDVTDLPEAPYVAPITLTDTRLANLIRDWSTTRLPAPQRSSRNALA